ncbi:MAG: export ABC transporter ATP-binding protein, partial [Acidobacteriota bacterium]
GLISRPELLILDEPTVGIDPQSRRHILDSVLALNHQGVTIIYTSHYMEEVEYLCNRVGIMDNGHLIALGGLNELKKAAGENETIEIQVGGLDNEDLASIAKINNVKQTRYEEDCLLVMTNDPASVIPTLSQLLYEQDCRVRSMRVQENNLETLFLNLTGKGLRD